MAGAPVPAPPTAWPSYQSWGRLAAASGMVGVVFNPRMSTADNVAFYSAGGPLSSVVLRDPKPSVRCVVLYYPYLDLEHMRVAVEHNATIAFVRRHVEP